MAEFWNNATAIPKRSHRFLLEFEIIPGVTTQIFARKASKPAFEIGQTEHKFLGQTYYYPGAITWTPVSVTLVNSATPDFDLAVQSLLQASGWESPDVISNGGMGAVDRGATINKIDASAALGGGIFIKEIAGTPGEDGLTDVLGTWELQNPWVKAVSFSDLDYSSEDLMTVDITFQYDWATYGLGNPVLTSVL